MLQLPNLQNYYMFAQLIHTGKCVIHTKDITKANWNDYYEGIFNLIKDGIELEELQRCMIDVELMDDGYIQLSIFDLYFNIIMWYLPIQCNQKINGEALFFPKNMTKKYIKKYFDKYIVKMRATVDSVLLNNILDDTLHKMNDVDEFSFYLCNTINLKDTIDLMNKSKEFNNLMHTSLEGYNIKDVKDIGMNKASRSIEIIKDSEKLLDGYEHCLKNSFDTGEGINPRQYKEFAIHIGSKPNGNGGVHPFIIDKSYLMGGLQSVAAEYIDSSSSRVAQIQTKNNTGTSGALTRILAINNIDSKLNSDLNYFCNTKNLIKITINTQKELDMLIDRYYKLDMDSEDRIITGKKSDSFLIGKTIYLYSPMTCASSAHGHGICRRCYGLLAYTNKNINIGKNATNELCGKLTQKQLSAKHLLETKIISYVWNKEFNTYFYLNVNNISLRKDNINYQNYSLIIDKDSIYSMNDTYDGERVTSDCYVTEFGMMDNKTGNTDIIKEKDSIEMFFGDRIQEYINSNNAEINDNNQYIIPLKRIFNISDETMELFSIPIANNDINKDLKEIEKLINKTDSIKNIDYDKDKMLEKFIQTIDRAKLDIGSVHLEVILMNQIRSIRTSLRKPNWEVPDEEYQILTLDRALKDNPNIIVSLIYQDLGSMLTYPLSYKKTDPSKMDVFFMEKPQEYLSNKIKLAKPDELIDAVFPFSDITQLL